MCKAGLAFFLPPFRMPCPSLCPTLFPHRGPRSLKGQAGLCPSLGAATWTSACKVKTQSSRVATVFKRQTDLLSDTANTEYQLGAWFGVEYNYLFLSDLTHHSWEPNLVEKNKFLSVAHKAPLTIPLPFPSLISPPFLYSDHFYPLNSRHSCLPAVSWTCSPSCLCRSFPIK